VRRVVGPEDPGETRTHRAGRLELDLVLELERDVPLELDLMLELERDDRRVPLELGRLRGRG
jgi:hypothetical protein